jgi:glucokinase
MGSGYVIGIDAGGTKVAYGLFDANGTLVERYEHPTDAQADGPAFSDGIIENVHNLLQKSSLSLPDLDGVGICMPSFILFDQGYVLMTSAMTNICDFPMRDYLKKRMPVPIVLDNDANVAALAEHRLGAGRGSDHMVYIASSTGIGSGIIINEKVFRGSYGWAGECGHMLVTPDEGALCGCRNQGCFMSYASGKYAAAYAKGQIDGGRDSILSECGNLSVCDIMEAYLKNDPLAAETLERMAHYLAVCVFNVYQMLNINLFVFGGGLVNCGDALFGRVRKEFDRFNHIQQPVYFRFAELFKDVGIRGAAELVRD